MWIDAFMFFIHTVDFYNEQVDSSHYFAYKQKKYAECVDVIQKLVVWKLEIENEWDIEGKNNLN